MFPAHTPWLPVFQESSPPQTLSHLMMMMMMRRRRRRKRSHLMNDFSTFPSSSSFPPSISDSPGATSPFPFEMLRFSARHHFQLYHLLITAQFPSLIFPHLFSCSFAVFPPSFHFSSQ